MSSTPVEHGTHRAWSRRPSVVGYYVYCEVVKLLRIPAFSIPTLLFPIMLFAFFGLPNLGGEIDGVQLGPYILASYGTYATMSVALFSFGVSIAAERGLGWNRLLRATPLQPLTYFVVKIVMALIIGLLTLLALFVFAGVVGGVRLPALVWAQLIGLVLLGMIPFVALGLCIGYVAGPNSAAAIANLIYLPLAFASGLLLPVPYLPTFVQRIAPYLPAYQAGQLGWTLLGAGDGTSLLGHLAWLGAYTIAFLLVGVVAYRRDEGKQYG